MRLRLALFLVIVFSLLFCGSAVAQVNYPAWDESGRDGRIDNNLHWGSGSQQGWSAQYYSNDGYYGQQQYPQQYYGGQPSYRTGGNYPPQIQCIRAPCGPQPVPQYGCDPRSYQYQQGCYNRPPVVQRPYNGGGYYGGYDPWQQYVAQLQRYCDQVARGNGRVFHACMQDNLRRAQSQRRRQQIGYAIGALVTAAVHIHYGGCGH